MSVYKCQCCQFEQEFADGEAAFEAGWDAPPHFTGFVCCNLCPAVCVVLGLSHEQAHAYWKEHGRTEQFLPPDEDFKHGRVRPAQSHIPD